MTKLLARCRIVKTKKESKVSKNSARRFVDQVNKNVSYISLCKIVAIRLRPLNNNESQHRRIWKVLPKYASVTQMTADGKPLPERVTGRTFFTFDKTFGEETTTQTVYDSIAKGIVNSAVAGVNGTIFAYGQTSSGKTFTMQGSGTIAEGMTAGGGGIVHMAAADIFKQIENTPDRIFVVRTSYLEIYNEEVRDLLSGDNKTLQIREDPRRGYVHRSAPLSGWDSVGAGQRGACRRERRADAGAPGGAAAEGARAVGHVRVACALASAT